MAWDVSWQLKDDIKIEAESLVSELNLDPVIINLLQQRGLTTVQQIKDFLNFNLTRLHNPNLMQGMNKAVTRLKRAVDKQEKIVIYGDYDCDGITSTASLMLYLSRLKADVDYYIPNRLAEGYGLNIDALAEIIKTKQPDLILTVDCGIKAYQEAEYLKDRGVDLLVTDHHTPEEEDLPAAAVLNPSKKECAYPDSYLAGVGTVFKLIKALDNEYDIGGLKELLVLTTMGTIADIVPLVGENRIITRNGLKYLNNLSEYQIENYGLKELLAIAGYEKKQVNAGVVGYNLAPRINAAGRMGQAELGVELFLAKDKGKAEEIAQKLNSLNNRRQEISQEIFKAAEEEIKQRDLTKEWVIVVQGKNWHSGVIGNVASDLNEKYHRPVILLSITDGQATGSARSIKNYNLYQALKSSSDILTAFGGHKQAAGLNIKAELIAKLRQNLNQFAYQNLTEGDLTPKLKLDSSLKLSELSLKLVEQLDILRPFGCRNPGPKFLLAKAKVKKFRAVGKSNKHLQLTLAQGRSSVAAIAFGMGDKAKLLKKESEVSLVFTPDINRWRDKVNLQLKVRDLKLTKLDYNQILLSQSEDLLNKLVGLNYNHKRDIKSDFVAEDLKFIDKRGKIKKDGLLKELLKSNSSGLIYVNDRQISFKLAKRLTKIDKLNKEVIIYDQALTIKDKFKILTKFKSGAYNWLVINHSFDYRLKESEFNSFIFYTPPFSKEEFKRLLALSSYNQINNFYLIYNQTDLKEGKKLLARYIPNRDLLAKIYLLFYQLKDKKGVIKGSLTELVSSFNNKFEPKISIETIDFALKVFTELEIISKEEGQIKLYPHPKGSLELSNSLCYNKGSRLKKDFASTTFTAELNNLINK